MSNAHESNREGNAVGAEGVVCGDPRCDGENHECVGGKIVEVNELLGSQRYVAAVPDPARLARTRRFVAWYAETPKGPDQWGRPQHGTVRTEIARGQA